MTNFVDSSYLVLPALVLAIALVLGTVVLGISFAMRRANLSPATAYVDILDRLGLAKAALTRTEEELASRQKEVFELDRMNAEVVAARAQLEAIRLELAQLDSARKEIEEVKGEAAAGAAELAQVNGQIEAARSEWERMAAEMEKGRKEIAALEESIKALRLRTTELGDEKRDLEAILMPLRAEVHAAQQILAEARAQESRLAIVKGEIDQLTKQIEDLARKRDELVRTVTDLKEPHRKRDELESEIMRLEARKERLIAETGDPQTASPGDLLEDLIKFPAFLATPATIAPPDNRPSEAESLHNVATYLNKLGLKYPSRTIKAFHTALKINDNAQITVLAGVSGTGKSLLPRRYAEAMGIHFLQIAVEPRWDSPQDLLGFYNYIEKKYRATDLARLLTHMDRSKSVEFERKLEQDRHDHLSLVLLDEMNLARVEYYFSEFLSRLEARPQFADEGSLRKRQDAMIPVDIRGLSKSIMLYPGHNVLFAGTMNDDESTQSLSDKVLDRGNVMQFAAPNDFAKNSPTVSVNPVDYAQSFKTWRTWVKRQDVLGDADKRLSESVIQGLARIMEESGRPFGHRLHDSILAYVANYPSEGNAGLPIRDALADQIEFRIMPKLRGLEIESHREPLESLQTVLRQDLQDQNFADRLQDLVEKQSKGTGLFSWRGLTRKG